MNRASLNNAPVAASAMVRVLEKSIEELERQLSIQRDALHACSVVASLPQIEEQTFIPPEVDGAVMLRTAMKEADKDDGISKIDTKTSPHRTASKA